MLSIKSSVVFAVLLAQTCSAAEQGTRKLSGQKFGTYQSNTQVTDHAAIAFDQEVLETQLGTMTTAGLAAARKVYAQGGFSKSFAEVSLTSALATQVLKGTEITGASASGGTVSGKALATAAAGNTKMEVQYATSDVQQSHVDCAIGGLPTGDQLTSGCFQDSGDLVITGQPAAVSYTYDSTTGNENARTLAGFSTDANTRMRPDSNSPFFSDFQLFVDYYGTYDFGDKWVQAAMDKTTTSFANGNANFGGYDQVALNEAIKKGTVYLNIAPYVIRELEDAIQDCSDQCDVDECNDDAVHALDEAAAFYYGGLYDGGDDDGNLLYALANKRCLNFKTCGAGGGAATGVAYSNLELTAEMNQMQKNLLTAQCPAAAENSAKIVNIMKVAFIQGALRYAYVTSAEGAFTDKAEAEGATFAAAVLPWVHKCSPKDATTIYNNLKVGQGGNADFAAVKQAFENTYQCMGVYCDMVGGIVDEDTGEFLTGTEPCTFNTFVSSKSAATSSYSWTAAISVAVVGAAALLL